MPPVSDAFLEETMTTAVATTTQPTVAPARPRLDVPASLRHVLRRLIGRAPDASAANLLPAPTGWPGEIPPGIAHTADSYTPGAAVWAYIAAAWLPASVTEIEGNSVLVTYQVPGTRETSPEFVHGSHLVPRGARTATPEAPPSPSVDAGQARASLLVHHADEHGMCKGCADLAHFSWAPCPAARHAMRVLGGDPAQLAGAR